MIDTPLPFDGFNDNLWEQNTRLPNAFFTDLLPLLDDLAELKVVLFCFWALPQKTGEFRYLRLADFIAHEPLMHGLRQIAPEAPLETKLENALRRAVGRGVLLAVEIDGQAETLYFMNTPRGKLAVEQIRAGHYRPGDEGRPLEILPERPTIYKLYESNIGPLTPMIGDELKDMEREFPREWVEDAFREAVSQNARKIKYIRAVLERWRSEGRGALEAANGTPAGQDGKRYVSGKFGDFIEH